MKRIGQKIFLPDDNGLIYFFCKIKIIARGKKKSFKNKLDIATKIKQLSQPEKKKKALKESTPFIIAS